jgi:hypothetical protein
MCDQSLFSLLNTKRREGGFEGGIAKGAEKMKTKMSKNSTFFLLNFKRQKLFSEEE